MFVMDSLPTCLVYRFSHSRLADRVGCSNLQVGLQQAVVKSAPTDDNLQIALVLAGKRRLMDRPKSEALQKTLARMQKNAMPAPGAHSWLLARMQ